jgi:hypothetical protein
METVDTGVTGMPLEGYRRMEETVIHYTTHHSGNIKGNIMKTNLSCFGRVGTMACF